MFGFSLYQYNESDGSGKDGQQTKHLKYTDTYITNKKKNIVADKLDKYSVSNNNNTVDENETLTGKTVKVVNKISTQF